MESDRRPLVFVRPGDAVDLHDPEQRSALAERIHAAAVEQLRAQLDEDET